MGGSVSRRLRPAWAKVSKHEVQSGPYGRRTSAPLDGEEHLPQRVQTEALPGSPSHGLGVCRTCPSGGRARSVIIIIIIIIIIWPKIIICTTIQLTGISTFIIEKK